MCTIYPSMFTQVVSSKCFVISCFIFTIKDCLLITGTRATTKEYYLHVHLIVSANFCQVFLKSHNCTIWASIYFTSVHNTVIRVLKIKHQFKWRKRQMLQCWNTFHNKSSSQAWWSDHILQLLNPNNELPLSMLCWCVTTSECNDLYLSPREHPGHI